MNTIRSKICGLTRVGDAQATAALGADAIGLVFFAGSKRCVSIEQAQKIVAALPPFVSVVALFVNETADGIRNVLSQVPIDIIQFHGDETPEFCQQFHRPYIKAVRVQNTQDMLNAMREFASARAVLFDAFVAGEYGGTGKQFDWNLLPKSLAGNWILAGGLSPDNIAEALTQTGARAVDVSGGVEEAAGVKSVAKMQAFLEGVKQASLER